MGRDAASMTPHERLDEIAALLARAYQRLLVEERKALTAPKNSQVPLDDLGPLGAACGSRVPSPQSTEPAA